MKTFTLVSVLLATAAAQITEGPNGPVCPSNNPGGNFCAGPSLQTNYIIRCVNGQAQPGNCNDNLAGVPPVGVKIFAPCYESSPTAGDAICTFNGTAYGPGGPFPIPTGGSSTSTASSTSSSISSSTESPATSTTTVVVSNSTSTSTTTLASLPVGTGSAGSTGGSGSGTGSGSGSGFNSTGSGGVTGPTPTATPSAIAIGAAGINGVANLAVAVAIGMFAIAF